MAEITSAASPAPIANTTVPTEQQHSEAPTPDATALSGSPYFEGTGYVVSLTEATETVLSTPPVYQPTETVEPQPTTTNSAPNPVPGATPAAPAIVSNTTDPTLTVALPAPTPAATPAAEAIPVTAVAPPQPTPTSPPDDTKKEIDKPEPQSTLTSLFLEAEWKALKEFRVR